MDLGSEIRDRGSRKNLFRIPDPWVKKAPDPGFQIRIRNTGLNDVKSCNTIKDLLRRYNAYYSKGASIK
jgi:hypothetical protein